MGFKEYAIHIAVRHHLMESLMHEIKTPEMADMLEEVMAARHARGEQVISLFCPTVVSKSWIKTLDIILLNSD